MAPETGPRNTVRLGGGIFGFGLGALVDVLVFHLILRWHHLLSAIYAPTSLEGLRTNVYYDGLFSLLAVGVMLLGLALLWQGMNRSTERMSALNLLGSLLVGAGAFNIFDGVVDHYVFNLHHVVHGSNALNPHWIAGSLLLVGVGILVLARND